MSTGILERAEAALPPTLTSPGIVYFSSVSENTKRFVDKVGITAKRIPLYSSDPFLYVTDPYVLVTPTYGAGKIKGSVPPQVRKFLADLTNRENCIGVICGGNTTFGEGFASAGALISAKIHVPVLYNFEVLGTREDVEKVRSGLTANWEELLALRVKSRKLP